MTRETWNTDFEIALAKIRNLLRDIDEKLTKDNSDIKNERDKTREIDEIRSLYQMEKRFYFLKGSLIGVATGFIAFLSLLVFFRIIR